MPSLLPVGDPSRSLALLGGALLALGQAATAQTAFVDVTAAAGINSLHTGNDDTEQGPGVAAGDFDGDGWQDMFVQNGIAAANQLYMNDGDGTFTDEAPAWGVDETFAGHGMTVGDYDDDGWLDVYLQNWGPVPFTAGQHRLYHNDGGTGFTDMAAFAGVTTTAPFINDGYGACFGDMDLDGDLDLFAGGWKLGSGGNHLFENNGDGTFTDVTFTNIPVDMVGQRTFAPEFIDMDKDRYPELILVCDFGTTLYLSNDGDGTFTDDTAAANWTDYMYGMGGAAADFDGNGWLDYYVSSIQFDSPIFPGVGNLFYLSDGPTQGPHSYTEASMAWNGSDLGWSWGVVAIDMDHDTWPDLVVNNGWNRNLEFTDEPLYVLHNQGGTGFVETHATTGPLVAEDGRGLMRFDYDNDGDMDVVVSGFEETTKLYRNDLARGSSTHWLRVFLDDGGNAAVAPNGYQATVLVKGIGPTQTRPMTSGGTFLSVNELSAHFGLGSASVVPQLEVHWPDGHLTTLQDVAADQTLSIDCCGAWEDLGSGLPRTGEFDTMRLAGVGDLTGNSAVGLLLDSALPSTTAWVVVGFSALNAPFKGGTLVPNISPGFLLQLPTDADGRFDLSTTWPAGAPSGLPTFFQVWQQDAGGPVGFTASNALVATTP